MRLIDADKFEATSYKGTETYSDCFDNGVLYMLEQIDNAPTVDAVEVVHGHWIRVYNNTIMSPCYECSECGRKINTWGVADEVAPYCHCGAKMEEVSE